MVRDMAGGQCLRWFPWDPGDRARETGDEGPPPRSFPERNHIVLFFHSGIDSIKEVRSLSILTLLCYLMKKTIASVIEVFCRFILIYYPFSNIRLRNQEV